MVDETKKEQPQDVRKSFELAEKQSRIFTLSPTIDSQPLPPPPEPVAVKKDK